MIKVSTGLTGKMEGINAISTSALQNPNCKRLSECKNTVCSKCYSMTALAYRKNARDSYARNGDMLSSKELTTRELPVINALYFRFESHGDLINETHLKNYVAICNYNPETNFALWSKQYKIVLEYFSRNPQPANLNILISSVYLNKPINLRPFRKLGLRCTSFTVYDKEHAEKVEINCGGRKCRECLKCYKPFGDNPEEIKELLK